ncbi:MAG: TolC family protein, partial [Muribaculaceae bacterium]|nr:TolC family protein [Muribaculaceae bacterium]
TVLISAIMSAMAQTQFDSVVDRILQQNLELKADSADMRAAIFQRRGEAVLPDPEIDGGYEWGAAGVGDKWNIGITQSFDWPGVYRSKGKAIKHASKAFEALAASRLLDKRVEIRELLIDYVYTKRQLAIVTGIRSRMDDMVRHYEKAYDSGEATIIDVNTVKIARFDAERRCLDLHNRLVVVEASIAEQGSSSVLLDPEVTTLIDYPAGRLYSLEEYAGAMADRDPVLKHFDLLEQTSRYDLEAQRRSRYPGFSIGYRHINELGDHFNGLSVGITLPVFSGRYKSDTALAQLESTLIQGNAARVGREAAMQADFKQASKLAGEIERFRDVAMDPRPVELLKKALDGGEITVFTYLEEVNYFDEARIAYDGMLYEYHKLLTRLNRYIE